MTRPVLPREVAPGPAPRRPRAIPFAFDEPPPGRPVRLWAMSDLRVDLVPLAPPDPPAGFDAVLVAGGVSTSLETSLRWLADAFGTRRGDRPVLFVPGNAEFWDGVPKAEALRRGRHLASELGIALLSDGVLRLDDGAGSGVQVVGATLWTDWSLHGPRRATVARGYARHFQPDCRRITLSGGAPYLPHDAGAAHARSRGYIEDCLLTVVARTADATPSPVALVRDARPGDRAVVVTHHAPSRRSLPAAMLDGACDEWVPASMASDLEDLMDRWGAPALWVHGHVPEPVDYRVSKTRVVANPRGGDGFGPPFDPALVLEV